MDKLQLQSDFNKGFTLKEGSNYLIVMSFGHEQVVAFEHFKAIAKSIFKDQTTFITVNQTIIQTKDIRMITPTKRMTEAQELAHAEEKKKYIADTTKRKAPIDRSKIPNFKDLVKKM